MTLVSALTGCATTPSPFPSATMLAEMAANQVAPPPRAAIVDVEEWKLTGPLPDALEPPVHAPGSPWDHLLVDLAVARARGETVLVTESAHCVAREIGLFRAAKTGEPPEALLRFIGARCGLGAADFVFGCGEGQPPAGAGAPGAGGPDPAALSAGLTAAMDRVAGAKAGVVIGGLWEGRKQDQALVCWVVAPRLLQTARVPMTADGSGRVVIEGELLAPAQRLEAAVTHGSAGVRRCVFRPEVESPHFSATCLVDRSDVTAWIEIAALMPDRVSGPIVLSMLVAPNGAPGDLFRRQDVAAPPSHSCAATAGGDLAGALVTCINETRAQAGLGPLAAAPAQSQTVARLAPTYFALRHGDGRAAIPDKLALGLAAGWDIPQPRRYGRLVDAHIDAAADGDRLLAALFARPLDRAALLDPAASVVAIATQAAPDQHFAGAVVVTYALMTDGGREQQAADGRQILRRLNAARARLGHAPIAPFAGEIGDTEGQARWVSAGHRSPGHGIWAAMRYAAVAIHWSHVHGWLRYAGDLDQIELPAPLLTLDAVELTVGVARYRPENEPWTRYLVMFVSIHPDGHAVFPPDNDVGYTIDPPSIRMDRVGR